MNHPISKIALELCVLLALFPSPAAAVPINITGTTDAVSLYNTIVPDPSISNITLVGTPLLIGAGGTTQSATFTYNGAQNPDLGFNSGIILSNGSAIGIQGNYYGDENYDNLPNQGVTKAPEAFGVYSGGFDAWNNSIPGGGDTTAASAALSMLTGFLPADTVFFDPNVLTFQFSLPALPTGLPTAWNLSFDYVFASEEYIDFINSPFDDAFGFFIDGINVALLGDLTPVSVNSIHPTDPANPDPTAHSDLYRNNVPGCLTSFNCGDPVLNPITWNSLNLDLEPDGLTTVLTTRSIILESGIHTATLVIADANDPELDSAVFIRGGSFVATPAVPEPGTLFLIGTGLAALGLLRRRNR